MPNQPTSFRLPFNFSSAVHPEIQNAFRLVFQGNKDLNDAIAALVPKVNANTSTITTVTQQAGGGGGGGGSVPVIFTRGGTILTPNAAINVIVWYAPFACMVTNVLGYVSGDTGSVINAQKNGSLTLLQTDLTLNVSDTWIDGGPVQNSAFGVSDKMEIMIISLAGAPSEIAVEVQCTRS